MEGQAGQDGHAQAVLSQGHRHLILLRLPIEDAELAQLLVDLPDGAAVIKALIGGDEGILSRHILHRDLLQVGQLAVLAHHQIIAVFVEREGLQTGRAFSGEEGTVQSVLLHTHLAVQVVALVLQLDAGFRELLPEGCQDGRHPLGRHTGEDAQPQQTALTCLGLLQKLCLHGLDLPHGLEHLGAHISQGHTPLASEEDLGAQFLLQIADDIAKAGLGIAQGLGSTCQTAALSSHNDR